MHGKRAGALLVVACVGLLCGCTLIERVPQASFDVSPIVVYANETVEFDASASSGPATIVSYSWELGNGTASSGRAVSTSYPTPGIYQVALTVEDARGRIDRIEQEIVVFVHSGTTIFYEDFTDGESELGHWPLDPTWATAGDATVDRITGRPGYALYVHSDMARWHRRYTAVTIPPLRIGQSVLFSCQIMTLQNQDEFTFLFSPARRELDSVSGSLPYFVFTASGGGSYVREPSEYGTDIPRPLPFLPDVYRWHTYAFRFAAGSYDFLIDGDVVYTGSLNEPFTSASKWILLLGEESLTEACRAYFDDITVSIEE